MLPADENVSSRPPWWKQPLTYLGLWLFCYVAASVIPWTQLIGYRSLVFFTGISWLSSDPLKAIIVWLGEPRHAITAMTAGTALLALQFSPRRTPRWRGREGGILLVGCLALLGTALVLPKLGWHVDHGYFPHEATFPSGHMSGFLCIYLALWSLGGRRWKRMFSTAGVLTAPLIGASIMANSAHTIWDVLGPIELTTMTMLILERHVQRSSRIEGRKD